MSPEKGRTTMERLAVLETRHEAMEKAHMASMSQIMDRQDAHEESVERRFLSVESTGKTTHDLLLTVNDNLITFMTRQQTKESEGDKSGLKLWQILAVVGAFVGPSVFEKIVNLVFGG